ncbi:MAG: phospho-N-acetylmuramoyl-pentapeptide-transferase [Candidatus Aminicenantes bacterium]|jgi:phospho-N-acetylmuramoyl-pentapeptide-transferase|nr:MAG: phospho-N-acetylmuramoyl-pentapeptide-transferase [Candidatus Aminicenantes bacterium]
MLYYLLVPLREYFIFFNVFRYITVRTALAGITAFLICLILGPWVIRMLNKYQIGEEISPDGPASHLEKRGTPSMGGILIIGATIIPAFLWGDLSNTYVRLAMSTMLLFGLLGFWDDFLKIKRKKSKGLIIRHKLFFQIVISAVIGLILIYLGFTGGFSLHLSLPFFKKWFPYFGWFYLPWIMLILVGSSNSVNLADGLDGLAIGLTLISSSAFIVLCYIVGRADWSEFLNIVRVPAAAELTVFAGAMAGACLGFLWFNCHPAQIFMGDAGALSLGGTIGIIAILIKQEFLLFMVAGVFIMEAISVLLQVSYFKLTGGKRIFKMAPLHHHFELIGWSEEKIVIRFWIAGIVFALFSLTALKLR